MRPSHIMRWGMAASLAVMLAPAAVLAAQRTVVIEVNDVTGKPVAGARVLIACDEKDAVATTDAQGRATIGTSSPTIEVLVYKDGQEAKATSSSDRVSVTLAGGAK